MTAPNSADGEIDPSGPQSPRPDAATQQDATSTDTGPSETGEHDTTKKTSVAARHRATTMKPPPTLLSDFLLGRPSPARVAADKKAARELARQRRTSLETVKLEMRKAAVQRIQAPGGVRDRVTKWQKGNAQAMAQANPLAAPSEPSEVNVQVDEESVTEEDRVKIKMRQKKRPPLTVPPAAKSTEDDDSKQGDQKKSVSAGPPKKRVVSDTNWVKDDKLKSPVKNATPKTRQPEDGGSPLPKDFLSRPSPNPPVSKKIQEWASRVEIPDEPRKRSHTARSVGSRSVGSGDGIRVRPIPSEIPTESDAVDSRSSTTRSARVSESRKSRTVEGDGIRVKPLPADEAHEDDKKNLRPQSRAVPDDGIRVRPMRPASSPSSTVRAPSAGTAKAARTKATNIPRHQSTSAGKEAIKHQEPSGQLKTPEKARVPTKAGPKKPSGTRSRRAKSMAETETTEHDDVSDGDSWTSGSEVESDIPSSIQQKPLADIPVGYSAFSELELPRGRGSRPAMKPKTKRQSSFKGATNVLKKALTEGKKILTEKVDPPKPALNQPPSIENWLKDTVDPFVDKKGPENDEPQRSSVEKEWVYESQARRSASPSQHLSSDPTEDDDSHHEPNDQRPTSRPPYDDRRDERETTSSPGGLRSSQATKVSPSAGRSATKRGFKEKIRDAFRGESTVQVPHRTEYSTYDEMDDDSDRTIGYQDRSRPAGKRRSPTSSDEEDSYISEESVKLKPNPLNPKRRPPTNGLHELSTIISDPETPSMLESELSSRVSETTITQTTTTRSTGLTRSAAISRKRSQKSGLKRRLTKHSDLVSALSLPDDSMTPSRSRSLRSAHSVRRVSNHLHDATVENLLQEFARDENLYSRELKTLVDGVIPVLLSQLVHGKGGPSGDIFTSPGGTYKEDPLPKAVVNMGIALEKLRNHHLRCPLADIHRLPQWLETITPTYQDYLDVWRLGFQGIIVNLAPASPDDEDSLLDAMPRNEEGDILNEYGDRIDVAHLLKRPLVRTKWITKFIQVSGFQPLIAYARTKYGRDFELSRGPHNTILLRQSGKHYKRERARDIKKKLLESSMMTREKPTRAGLVTWRPWKPPTTSRLTNFDKYMLRTRSRLTFDIQMGSDWIAKLSLSIETTNFSSLIPAISSLGKLAVVASHGCSLPLLLAIISLLERGTINTS